MSVSVQIPNSVSFYDINDSRVERLLSHDREYATYMGLWDKFKDYFRYEKKSEALEKLYDFIHHDDILNVDGNDKSDPLSHTINAFEKIKSLAKESHQDHFKTQLNPYHGVDFFIDSHVIKTVDNSLQSYALHEINHHPTLKSTIGDHINTMIQNKKTADLPQLILDMKRQDGGAINHNLLDNTSEQGQKITEQKMEAFYASLTPQQQDVVAEVASQSGFAHVHMVLLNDQNVFGQHFALVNVNPNTVMYRNADSEDITVIQTLRRTPTDDYYQAIDTGLRDVFPIIQSDVAFTISPNGHVECTLLHISDTLRPPALSLEALKATIN